MSEAKKAAVGVIGGTGVYTAQGVEVLEKIFPQTPWGKPSDEITIARYQGLNVAFLPRHGKGHFITPSNIPSRANIAALKRLGVEEIISFSAVGSLKEEIIPGHFVLPNQIIDRTRHRHDTFYDEGVVVHVSFGDPFSSALADIVTQAAADLDLTMHHNETLICMEGPAFSTRAESKLYKSWGAGIINMSVLPEAKLAREAEIAYQMICMATDYDSWRPHEGSIDADQIMKVVQKNSAIAQQILRNTLGILAKKHPLSCPSKEGVRFGIMTAPDKRTQQTRDKLNWLLPDYF